MSNKSLDKILISLAFIKVNWDQQRRDYIDNFLPFLATLIVRKGYKLIEENAEQINKIVNDFTQEFGLHIPYHPMIAIINRAKKRGLLRKREHNFIPTDNVYKYDFSGKTQAQKRKYENLINSFIDFCKKEYDENLNKEEAGKTLIGFLKQHDLEILFAAYDKSALPKVTSAKSNIFLFNKFVESIYKAKQELFHALLNIVVGHILANIVLYGYEFTKLSQPKLKNLNLYLDTKFIFRSLGVEREEIQSVYSELLAELKKQGVNLFVFRHTYEEIIGILQNCLMWIENSEYDSSKASPVLRYFKEQDYRESDVQMFINRVDKTLNESGIKKLDTPDPNIYARYQIDEDILQKLIIKNYKTLNPAFEVLEKVYTIQKDIQSISAIYKLRKGEKPQNIREAKHVFTTTNSALAYANKIFEKEEYGQGFYIPTCVTDTLVGTLIWLNNPQKEEINVRKFIADICVALQPSEELLKRYLVEVEKLREDKKITEDDYILLINSQVAKELLAEETLGDPDKFTPKTPIEILEEIKKEAHEKYMQEKKEHEKTKRLLEAERDEKIKYFEELYKKINKIATYTVFVVLVIFVAFSVLSYYKLEGTKKWIVIIGLLIFGIISLLGIQIRTIKEKITKGILKFLGVKR